MEEERVNLAERQGHKVTGLRSFWLYDSGTADSETLLDQGQRIRCALPGLRPAEPFQCISGAVVVRFARQEGK